MDYSSSLNLPKTDFPMRANLPKRELEILQKWEQEQIYSSVRKAREKQEKFILHDGPPYANGDIHMGHALNKVLKDIIIKYKTMQGYDAPYVPGWDTHGLPIEHQIIKTRKVKREDISSLDFRRLCRDYALEYVNVQREQFKRLGVRGDWEHPYITLKPEFEARQIEIFGEMALKGYIYKGLKSVYWCPECETALAEAEVEYQDDRTPSIFVRFAVRDGKGKLPDDGSAYIIIWTTTPWTIPANVAIALHPDLEYVLVHTGVGNERYLLAAGLLSQVKETVGGSDWEVELTLKGSDLEGVVCTHPLYDRESVVILGDHVTLEQGSGCVHTAPGHGQEDFEIGLKYHLPILSPMDGQGRFTEEAAPFTGLRYDAGNKAVTEALDKAGALLNLSFFTHSYPHCWRCKKPIIFRATDQWFASIDGFRQEALDAIKNVNWVPSWGEGRIHNMVVDRHDWCISRQRVWGVPIPIFYCNNCGKYLVTEESIKAVADLFRKEGSDAWLIHTAEEILPGGTVCSYCGGSSFRKETDIMDVWFDSGSTHAAVLENHPDLKWPADLYLEGSDQYRGWFQSSLLTSVATNGNAPYRSTLTHGWVVDGEGKKMSKSTGNVIAPAQIIKQYGADILRLWVSSADFTSDVRVSQNILKQLSEVYRKIRNTCRFLIANCGDFNPDKDRVPYSKLSELDRWALHRLQTLIERVTNAYEKYQFHVVFHAIHNFCTVDMSNFYLDVIKDRLYVEGKDSVTRRASQTVLNDILAALAVLIAPILTFTAEEIWNYLPMAAAKSVQTADWPKVNNAYIDKQLAVKWSYFLESREEMSRALEEARREKKIRSSLEARIEIFPDKETFTKLEPFREELAFLCIVSGAKLHSPDDFGKTVPEDALALHKTEKLTVAVFPAEGEKCQRCWVYDSTVDYNHPEYPGICSRCRNLLSGE